MGNSEHFQVDGFRTEVKWQVELFELEQQLTGSHWAVECLGLYKSFSDLLKTWNSSITGAIPDSVVTTADVSASTLLHNLTLELLLVLLISSRLPKLLLRLRLFSMSLDSLKLLEDFHLRTDVESSPLVRRFVSIGLGSNWLRRALTDGSSFLMRRIVEKLSEPSLADVIWNVDRSLALI